MYKNKKHACRESIEKSVLSYGSGIPKERIL